MNTPSFHNWNAALLLSSALALSVAGQDLGWKAPPQKEPILISGATIHTISGAPIERGWISFADGKITGVGPGEGTNQSGRVIHASGKHVAPGFIHPFTRLGLMEIASIAEASDFRELGDVTPEVRAVAALNPDSTLLPVARANGILLAGVFPGGPGSGSLISGRAGVCRLNGWTSEDLTVSAVAGLHVNWPMLRPITATWMKKSVEEQRKDFAKELARVREVLDSARAYFAARSADPSFVLDHRYEGMRPIFPPLVSGAPKQLPVFVSAQTYEQITSALSFAREYSLKLVFIGGSEAPLCADLLKSSHASVILLGTNRLPRRTDDDYDQAWRLPLELDRAGVKWCLASAETHGNDRNLPYEAAAAVAHGLEQNVGLRSITLAAAEILGIDDRYGSLDAGKSATLIITSQSPLEITTQVDAAFIDGRELDLSTKQTNLRDKYLEKYKQLGILQ